MMSRRTPSDVGFVIVVIIMAIALIIASIIYINEPPSQPTNETITTSIDPGKIDPTRLAQAENASRDEVRQNLNAGPIDDAFNYVKTMETYQPPTPEPEPELTPETNAETSYNGGIIPHDELPAIMQVIDDHESTSNGMDQYRAYNPTGCSDEDGTWSCGGRWQLSQHYAATWAAAAGFSGQSSNAETWDPAIQDTVAMDLYYKTGGSLWCDWTDYC